MAAAFDGVAGFSLMESKSGATRGLMYEGKSFGMSSHGRLILKLTEARSAELITDGVGVQFYPSPDRPMKGWLEVSKPDADWVGLAREAHAIAVANFARARSRKASASGAGPAGRA